MLREKTIIQTSIIGIITNVLLAGLKAAVGLLSHSIAITLDALNNLSDALSSVITIIGAKLANKAPDKEHPLGHGRLEYISYSGGGKDPTRTLRKSKRPKGQFRGVGRLWLGRVI